MPCIDDKLVTLKDFISSFESMLIAYSGGVDSTFLAVVAHQILGERMLAVTAASETYPESEKDEAIEIAKKFGFRHIVAETSELNIKNFANNPPNRCYYCKKELFGKLKDIALDECFFVVAEGTTLDDEADFRPGKKAIAELGIISPLKDCGLSKDDIRQLSEKMGIPTAQKASFACLASRFPYGNKITADKLHAVGMAEKLLKEMGFKQFRVRHHGEIARIEVELSDLSLIIKDDNREKIITTFKYLGFKYISLDLEGYRTGSMNEVLEDKDKYL